MSPAISTQHAPAQVGMSHGKQFTLFSHVLAPNGWKIAFVLNILQRTYEPVYLDSGTYKSPEHVIYNPNGRIPTLIDHSNGDLVLWESGAILLYLVDTYDTEHKISVACPREKAVLIQWLFFQTTGQGPYFGQSTWFRHFHPEKIPSAIARYQNEARRVLGVLESVLSQQEYLVAGKVTIADIAFVPYNNILQHVIEDDFDFKKEFPNTYTWHCKVAAVDGVRSGLEEHLRLITKEETKNAS
ncbi:Glutathione S-transferase 2 [Steccherinum ochraceum]|uniref:glutathione transferase n=1 Tax=Steccherinum ochraceum TaxID=92696 RepID=A0A4V2MV60_9APHY|nr:Glutathione S-transferase 2 [Steccherinum ochraceum]